MNNQKKLKTLSANAIEDFILQSAQVSYSLNKEEVRIIKMGGIGVIPFFVKGFDWKLAERLLEKDTKEIIKDLIQNKPLLKALNNSTNNTLNHYNQILLMAGH